MNDHCSLAGLRACLMCAVLAIAGLVLLSGCGGGGGGGGLPAIISIIITEDFAAHVGDVVDFHVWGEQETSGWRLLYNQDLTWESSDTQVGTIDNLGEFTATGLGTTEVTGTYEDLPPASALVTVVEPGPQPTAVYYPLGIGYSWQYTGSEVEPGGVRPQQEITLTVTCLRQIVAIGKVWYELRVQFTDPQQSPRYMYFQHDDAGLHELYADNSTLPRLKHPVEAGTQWPDPQAPEHYFVIESDTETVDVPAAPVGGFENCVRVREHNVTQGGDDWDIFAWFRAGVGVVKSEYFEIDPDTGEEVRIYQELVDYSVGG